MGGWTGLNVYGGGGPDVKARGRITQTPCQNFSVTETIIKSNINWYIWSANNINEYLPLLALINKYSMPFFNIRNYSPEVINI